jgi:hypothetical protein
MRLLICFFVLSCAFATAQTSQDLHSRYGEPDRERFLPRPNISLTVQYGPDHLVCGALVEPPTRQPLLAEKVVQRRPGEIELHAGGQEPPQYMNSDAVTDILEQVAPTASRGQLLRDALMVDGCRHWKIAEYEHVSIMRGTDECHPQFPDRDFRASVKDKRDECKPEVVGRNY